MLMEMRLNGAMLETNLLVLKIDPIFPDEEMKIQHTPNN
jgi:hypothetical protein